MSAKKKIVFIVGPTASGKSKIAISLAVKLKSEIISCDSMLVYKGMNIGTDKPSALDQKKIKHHMIDIVSSAENYSVFDFFSQAISRISTISAKGKIPVICGGSGLYAQALIKGLDDTPPPDEKFRARLEKEFHKKGSDFLFQKLLVLDPQRAIAIHPNNMKRVIRAIEISRAEKNNKGIHHPGLQELGFEVFVFGINRDRQLVYARIDQRVDKMFRRGLIREAKTLLKRPISTTASQALGYKQVFSHLKGELSLSQAKELIKLNTRHFAKRQWTWFNRDPLVTWINCAPTHTPKQVVKRIMALLGTLA